MRVASIAPLAAAACLLVGCGGAVYTTSPGSSDSGTADGGGRDATPLPDDASAPDGSGDDSSSPWSPVCPATLPAAGTACSQETLQCEYGSAWWSVSCDTVMQCQSGQWTAFKPSYEPCSAKPGPNPATCPPDYASVPQGATCSMNGLTCIYDQAACACQVLLGGPVQLDGGTAEWECLPAEQGCPFPRARVGTACPNEGTVCSYEECSYGQMCQNGVWQAELEGCALAGGGPGGP
jgi:hypothetical protein